MKPDAHKAIERYRITTGKVASDASYGNNGAFLVPYSPRPPRPGIMLGIIVSDGEGWDHVSVSLPNRCPSWEEMCFVKDLFFEPHEVAIQIHPARSEYVNHHPFCLHLFRHQTKSIPTPPSWMVGPRREGEL